MHSEEKKYNQVKNLVKYNDFKSIIAIALSHHNLAKLVNKLKLNAKDMRTTKIPTTDLAELLANGAYSDPNIFQEVGMTLDLYSGEAIKAVKKGGIENFQNSVLKEKGHRRKINTARLIWALLNEDSPEKNRKGIKKTGNL